MQNPRNLRVTAEAEELAVEVYEFTKKFPGGERFGLAQQMRRAAVSVGSNITEGCGRAGNRALIAFLYVALGSANELQFQLRIAQRLAYGTEADCVTLTKRIETIRAMISRLIKGLQRVIDGPIG